MSYRRVRAALPAVALMLVVMLAAGCAASTTAGASAAPAASHPASGSTSSAQPGSPAPVPTITATGTPAPGESYCANWPSGVAQGPLPATFVPVQVLRCDAGTTTIPGKGVYVSGTLERATEGLAVLVNALRQPSGHMQPGMICPALELAVPQLVLIAGNGAMLSPRVPVNDCGIVQQEVLTALKELPWQTVSVRLISQLPDVGVTASVPATPSASPASGGGHENGIPQANANN
jgi:hypothetical protein